MTYDHTSKCASSQGTYIHNHHHLLAPVPDFAQEQPLAVAEGPVRGRDEDNQVRAWHDGFGNLLVALHNRIRPRGVDDMQATKKL